MRTFAVQSDSDQMYFIHDPVRKGMLTWDHRERRYVMAFTTSDKAEEYNAVVLKHSPGKVVSMHKREGPAMAKSYCAAGVHWMIVDYPVINDQDFWEDGDRLYPIEAIPTEHGRNYAIVDLRKIVARS
jgi:hypothetical protein